MDLRLMEAFRQYLLSQEKRPATREKYLRDVRNYVNFLGDQEVSLSVNLAYKQYLEEQYAPASANSMIAAVNAFLSFLGREDLKLKRLRVQKKAYCPESAELTRGDYEKLVLTARAGGKQRLALVIQTLCVTGIRVSELAYITREAVERGEATVTCKGKTRTILIVSRLRKRLLQYARQRGIQRGPIFTTRTGQPLNRSNIWKEMKALCALAGVPAEKVFPHNLRHLFARTFYALEKDIAKLADVLGHSNINTTRIYIISTGAEHRRKLERMHLLV